VNRVVDGDTFSADFDLGWGTWSREVPGRPNRVRILGLNTPEKGEPGFDQARTALAGLLGPQCWVTSTKLDSFGRSLANVRTLDGRDVRAEMPEEWWS
jgi:endonuclease YncB( thermonuclease family)